MLSVMIAKRKHNAYLMEANNNQTIQMLANVSLSYSTINFEKVVSVIVYQKEEIIKG